MVDWLVTTLSGVRVLAHLVTFFMIAIYYKPPEGSRFRLGVSLLASILAGSTLALALLTIFVARQFGYQIFDTTLAVALAVLAVRAGGDVARLLPRQPWCRS